MPRDAKLDMLQSVPLFAGLARSDLQRVAQLADTVDLPADKVLMRQGNSGAEMFVVESGSARVDRDGVEIARVGPGQFFGEMALVAEGPRTATVTTLAPSRMFVVGHREFHALMDDVPSVRDAVLACVADRIRRLEAGSGH